MCNFAGKVKANSTPNITIDFSNPTVCPKVPLNSNVVLFLAICGLILKPFDLQIATLGRFDMMYDMP